MIYDSLTSGQLGASPAANGSPEAWGAYLAAMRDQLITSKASALSAYNTLKQVRSNLGLPFSTAKSGEGYADLGAWPADYEQQAVDIIAMSKVFVDAANDALAGKRKLFWDDQSKDFAIEGFSSDVLRLQYGSSGQAVLVDASGNQQHPSGQIGNPVVFGAIAAVAVVESIGIGFLIYKAFETFQVVAQQKTERTVAEATKKTLDLVAQGVISAAEAEKLNKSIYDGATDLRKAATEPKAKETSDIASAVKTIAWVGLGVGVLYVVAQVLKGGALGMPALAGARDNPDYTRNRWTYLPAALRDVPPFTPSGTDLEIWTWEDEQRGKTVFHGIAFAGKAGKPLWHHWFGTAASRMSMIEKSIASRKSHLKWREERTGARKDFQHTLKVGDVLYTSYGYDQTNVSFYEVVETKGKSVVVCKIGSKEVEAKQNLSYVVAIPGKCYGKTSLHRVGEGNSVKIDDHYASKWEGKPVYETASGWGH